MNCFESKYTSKIKRIVIPIPGFQRYNKTITEEGDSEFIGRERIMSRIISWLTESKNFTGACLVTGYRGMGKSSFVGEALSRIVNHSIINKRIFALLKMVWLLFTCHFLMYIPLEKRILEMNTAHWFILFGLLFVAGALIYQIYRKCMYRQEFLYFPVKINIGRDVYNEKDILYLITKNVYKQYTEYYKSTALHPFSSLVSFFIKWSILVALVYLYPLVSKLICHIIPSDSNLYAFLKGFYCFFPYMFYLFYFVIGYAVLSACEKAFIFIFARYYALPFMPLSIVNNDLVRLNDRIDASIKLQVSGKASGWGFLREKQYQLASVREIEHELISIFEKINQIGGIPFIFPKIRFIFVLDELDKADVKEFSSDKKEDENNSIIPQSDTKDTLGGIFSPRKRKENLIHTLAGMKYFLSTVKAKFIFVAGQELYDAYLADLSDRQFSLSSIFNEVISVDSFLKSYSSDTSIITMTERLLCKQLMTVEQRSKDGCIYPKYETLQHYHTLLVKCKKSPDKHPFWKLEIEQRILFLYHFIYYLLHTSNGSPKKMILNLETYIKPKSYIDDKYIDETDRSDYYLSIGDTQNFKINFVHYLAYPTIQGLVNQSQLYTDKLLVSSSFLINHIYKYHNTGFSWRNLEYIPELLDINKMPGLRDFIGTMINFMRQVHLEPIFCGLYLFKFPMHLAEEISIASSRSDELSALFNFSRDDSSAIKEHYMNLIRYYSDPKNTGCEGEATLLPSIHHILGDIYLADEEYAIAISEYQTALQLLKRQMETNSDNFDTNPHLASYMLFYVRNMLKLGVAYEKRKTYNSAYVTYNELIDKLIGYRYLNEDDLGFEYKQLPYNRDWDNEHTVLFLPQNIRDEIVDFHNPSSFYASLVPGPSLKLLEDLENFRKAERKYVQWESGLKKCDFSEIKGVQFKTSDLHNELNHISLTPWLKSVISRISVFEDIRFIYLAPLARLFVLEKMQSGGITRLNIDQAVSEFNYLHLLTDSKYKSFLFADFYRKLAEILYYKNHLTQEKSIELDNETRIIVEIIKRKYDIELNKNENENENNKSPISFFDVLFLYGYDIKKILHDWFNELYRNNDKKNLTPKDKSAILYIIHELWGKYLLSRCTQENIKSNIDKLFDGLIKISGEYSKSEICIEKPNISFDAVYYCGVRQKKALEKGLNLPCYACKYYHISLQTLLQNLIPRDYSMNRISCMNLIKWIIKDGKSQIRNLTELQASLIATTLEGIGNTFLSCMPEAEEGNKEVFSDVFVAIFPKLIKVYYSEEDDTIKLNNKELKISKLKEDGSMMNQAEKSILYYWFATVFFSEASNMLAAFRCNKRILEVFSTCINNPSVHINNLQDNFIHEMEENIIKRALRRIYSHYEHINFSEVQQMKIFFSKQQDEIIPLRYLSHFPEIDEFLTVFYTLKLSYLRKRFQKSKDKKSSEYINLLKKYYNHIQMGRYKLVTTFNQNIHNMQFNVFLNECILCECGFEDVFESFEIKNNEKNHFVKLNQALAYYWEETDIRTLLDKIGIDYSSDHSDNKLRKDLIEFLIMDSLFCLSKMITQILPQTNSTLYTNSFIAHLYYDMYMWNTIKVGLYHIYHGVEISVYDYQKCLDSLESFTLHYCKQDKLTSGTLDKLISFYNRSVSYVQSLSELSTKPAQEFMKTLRKNVGDDSFKLLDNTYLAEYSLAYYRKSCEMNHGGNAYKQMISYMNFLDDDLNNDTSQFYLAIERFKLNNNSIQKRINNLRVIVYKSGVYQSDNYIQDMLN